ncbi:MAG: hypothetical protein RLZZ196_583 [Bacteroidota bacterium]|jgi:TP901 family phage tail tape measure protein
MPLQIPVTQTGLEASIQQAMRNAGRNTQLNLGVNSRQINALAQPLGRITGQADEFTKSMEAANARVFAFGASVGIINGVSKAFSALVKNTIEVEKSLVEINTVLNTSGDSLQKFGNKLFDVAKSTGQTFDVVAKGALELARQGLSTEETLKRINDALILSRLSGLDAQQSVEGLTAAFNSFKETGITTSQILNKLVVVSQKYSVSERDLIEGLKRSASVADQAGVSFDELVGIITTVQERTARGGAVIGNAFKTIFARIQNREALEDLANLGVQITDLQGKVLPATQILQNLALEFNNLTQVEQADLAKKLGGIYQLSNLLAAVKDLSSEQSKYNDIVRLSVGATDEAYKKNAALNETLAALINKVSVSAQQLGATLGAIGITDSLKGLLDFFNNILEGIQNILGEESMLGDMFRGLAKGIGNVLAGPGLALFGAIIAKLSKDLISFGLESLKSFFKIGQSAKEIQSVEKAIAAALGSNLGLQRQLFALEGNRAAQIKLMTEAIVQQEAVMRRMAATAGSLAAPLYQQGVRSTGGQGLRVPKAAGGYMPAVTGEASDIRRGVGGARSGDRPVVIPNFAFGGGKKGTMVAHTGEYIVPNFAKGGSAIFNRDMVASMGLPSGAQKIGTAGGFIPNFQKARSSVIPEGTSPNKLRGYAAYEGNDPTSLQRKANAQKLLDQKTKTINVASILGSDLPTILTPNQSGLSEIYTKKNIFGSATNAQFQFKSFGLQANGKQSIKNDFERRFSDQAIEKIATDTALSYARKIVSSLDSKLPVDPKTIKEVENVKGFISSAKGAFGGIFDAAITTGIKTVSRDNSQANPDIGGDFDVNAKGDSLANIIKLFGSNSVPANGLADFKINKGKYAVKSMAEKILNSPRFVNQLKASALNKATIKASRGYIPNFANPLAEAIDREMSAGVPASQIYVDQNSSLKNSMNPMGLMVANRRDEPSGGMQGINRARKEGANPMLYGAAGGFIPNYAATSGSDADLEKPKRDLLGTVFAVQTGLSLLTGATSDATSGLGKFTNNLSNALSNVSTALLALQGLKGLAPETGKLAGALGRLGPVAIAAVGGFEAFKFGIQVFRDWTGKTAAAAKSTAQFNDAVAAAGISLDNLSKSESLKKTTSAEGSLYNLGAGIDLTDDIFGRAYKDPELQKMYAQAAYVSGMSEKQIAEMAASQGAVRKIKTREGGKRGGKLVDAYTDFDADKFRQTLADITAMPEKGTKEYEERIKRITELREKQAQVEKDLNEPARIAEAKEAISSQIKETLKLIRAQELLNARKLGETAAANQAEVNNQQRILEISSDLTLSATERAKKLAEQENIQVRITAELEAQSQIADKLDESVAELSKGGIAFGSGMGQEEIEKAVESSKKFIENISKTPSAAGAISQALKGNNTELSNLITGSSELGDSYKQNEEYIKLMTIAILQFTQGEKNILNLLDQEASRRNELYDISVKTKQNEEARAAIASRVNYQLESRASALDFQSQGVSNKQQINQARKELETAVYERTALTTTVEDYKKGLDEINRKYFDLEMAAQREQAALEIKSEVIRNLKVDENNLKLTETTTALNELKNTVDTAVTELPTILQNTREQANDNSPMGRQMTAFGAVQPTFNQNDLRGIAENGANVAKLNPQLAANLEKFAQDFQKRFGEELQISGARSAYRTIEESAAIRQKAIAERGLPYALKYTATPGRSQHNFGNAVDFSKSQINKAVSSGMRLEDYGLTRPMSYEPWHVELLGARNKNANIQNITNAQQLTTQQFGLSDKAYAEAIKLATLDISKVGDAARKAAEGLLGANAPAEEIDKLAETIKNAATKFKSAGATEATAREIEKIQRQREAEAEMSKTFSKGWTDAVTNINKDISNFQYELGQAIPTSFSNNLAQGIQDAITGAKSLEDALVSAALSFVQEIQSMAIKNLANQFTSSFSGFLGFSNGGSVPKYASGGMINGGSGSKDDVPAMLMGGEYVINKKSVQKYGPDFLSAINSGALGGYASGGQVQSGAGGFYIPGAYGLGGIEGRQNLLDFASQTATSGQYDVIRGGDNYASINLEAESARLTNFGRSRGPMAEAVRSAKEESFGLYQQDIEAEKQRKEQQRQLDEQSKAMKTQLLISIGSMVAGSALSAGASGFNAAFGAAKAGGATTLSSFGSGLKGIFTGASATGGVNVGGLNNWFTGIGKGLTGNFSDAASYFKLSQMGSLDKLGQAYSMGVGYDGKMSSFNQFLGKSGYIPRAFPVNPTEPSVGSNGIFNWFKPTIGRATGGIIPPTSGIDTVPAMLSGGEFVMNRAASQNIGTGNLQALNAGAGSLPTEEKTEELNDRLVAKLDELIEVMTEGGSSGSITINVDSNGKSTQETSGESSESREKLARQIKDTVMKVIEQEKRLGGKLRRGLT